MDKGTGDSGRTLNPGKTLKVSTRLLEKLGVDVEIRIRSSPGPSQMTRNSEGLETHTQRLKHPDSNIKWPQAELEKGYKIGIRKANLDVLRGLKNMGVTHTQQSGHGNQWKPEQKKNLEDGGTAACHDPLKAADQILDKEREAMPLRGSLEPCEAGRIDWWI